MDTRQERREAKARNRRKMRVSGASVRLLQALAQRRADAADAALKERELASQPPPGTRKAKERV